MRKTNHNIIDSSTIALLYYFVIIPFSKLPFWVLYRISDFAFYIFYYFVQYRKKVVFEGLRNSFPEKSNSEIEEIAKEFYRHLCDLIFESFKGFGISKSQILKRHRYTNIEVLESYYKKGARISILGSHFGNWEWVALSLPLATQFKTHGIYQTLTNPFMNRVVKTSRERHGMKLIPKEEVETIFENTKGQEITMGFIADQSPSRHGRHYWLKFLNQDTATTSGFEYFAKKYDTPVLYLNVEKVRRGYYECTFSTISNSPKSTKDGEIIETYMKILENIIKQKPAYWLWSHRRWKISQKLLDKP